MIINWTKDNCFLFTNSHFSLVVYKASSYKDLHSLYLVIEDSCIIKKFHRLLDLRNFVLQILHLYGYRSLTYDIFLHPEDYM